MSLIDQLELEKRMMSVGTKRFMEKIEKDGIGLDSAPIQKIVDVILLPFTDAIDAFISAELKTKKKRKHVLTKFTEMASREGTKLKTIDVAFLTSASLFSNLFNCHNEYTPRHKMVGFATKLGNNLRNNVSSDISDNDIFRCSDALIKMFATCFDELCTLDLMYFDNDSKNKEYVLEFTQDFYEFVEETIEAIAEMTVVIYPMVFRPEDWDDKGHGGGWYSEGLKRNIVKRRNLREHAGTNQLITNSVNLIQATPWQVNRDIMSVINTLKDSEDRFLVKKVFPKNIPEDPAPPFDMKWSDMSKEQKKQHAIWKGVISKNDRARKAKQSVDYTRVAAIRQAEQFSEAINIFFPHDLDYRMRNYNIAQTGLSTQGSDIQKGLIQMANPRVIETDSGIRWMRINMANLVGHDKMKLDEREAWTTNNEELIRECVKNPLKTVELWSKWDKPVQGMAAAIEYAKWLDHPELAVNTHIQLDGLCNGVQNLAALTRDHKVAPHVGLIHTETRGDVYQYVCDTVIAIINGSGSSYTKEWIESGLLDRSLTKKPVMTRSYAAKLYGIKTGVADYIEDEEAGGKFTEYRKAGFWMGEQIWSAMEESLAGPMMFLDWVQACAKVIGVANKPFIWTNPIGGRCYQSPMKYIPKRLKSIFDGKTVQYQLLVPTDKINVGKLESSCSPNMIHSCDASHLMNTVNRCHARGITDFAMVHDSFGVSPDDAAILLEETKNAWVEQYEKNWLEFWYQEWCDQLGPELAADLPHWSDFITMGELDISAVQNSDFFFS